MGLMYEVPSFGRTYFEGDTADKPVVVGVGVAGVQLLDASDGDRPVLAEYGFGIIGSFVCSDEARSCACLLAACLPACLPARVVAVHVIPRASCVKQTSSSWPTNDLGVNFVLNRLFRREKNAPLVIFEQECFWRAASTTLVHPRALRCQIRLVLAKDLSGPPLARPRKSMRRFLVNTLGMYQHTPLP